MAKKPSEKVVKVSKTNPTKKTTRKAPAALAASLVVAKHAPAAATLTAPVATPVLQAEASTRRGRGPNRQPVDPTELIAFRLPKAWAKEFRTYAFNSGRKYGQCLIDAFEALKEKEAL